MPPFVVVEPGQTVREAIALLHEHSVSQLPVVEEQEVVGSVGERGLLRRAMDTPTIMETVIAEVMEEPFPSVERSDSVREAVELLVGERQALTVTEDNRPLGILTRADLLESLVT
jgi:cystathionine beta-synthase